MIDDAQGHGDGSGVMPFHLWPAQVNVLWALMQQRLVVILKARQLGISWLCCWYALWLALFNAGKVVLLFSRGQDEADELLRRVKSLYERLPLWLLAVLPKRTRDNTDVQGWANGSRIQSFPATPGSGRSFTASLVIVDEAAFLQWGDGLFVALKPTIDAGGQLIIVSTANGVGNLFHRLWVQSVAGRLQYTTIFLPWWARPGRDAAWYAAQLREYTDPAMVKQEYPASAQEAFLVSGRPRFAAEWLGWQTANLRSPLPWAVLPTPLRTVPGLAVYTLPRPGRRAVIGADVAEGTADGDYSAAVVLDVLTGEELASLHGHWEPDVFAQHLAALARAYHADLAVERNNHGHAVLVALKALQTPRIVLGHDGRRGWLTTEQTKVQGVDGLAASLRDRTVTIRTQATLDELQIYSVLKNGSTGAPHGYHDDRVMAWLIARAVAYRPQGLQQSNYREDTHQ